MKNTGVTFFELLIVILLISVFAQLVWPSWQSLQAKNATDRAVTQMLNRLDNARQQAILRNQTVSLCSSDNAKNCLTNWSQGYLIFLGQPSAAAVDSSAIIFYDHQADAGQWSVQTFAQKSFITFATDGTTIENGTLTFCPKNRDPHYARALFLSQSGRVRLSTDQNHDGVDEDSNGVALSCQN
jgi:type IV fimbrial biogenesis protein FimT